MFTGKGRVRRNLLKIVDWQYAGVEAAAATECTPTIAATESTQTEAAAATKCTPTNAATEYTQTDAAAASESTPTNAAATESTPTKAATTSVATLQVSYLWLSKKIQVFLRNPSDSKEDAASQPAISPPRNDNK